jgi:CrcB protein
VALGGALGGGARYALNQALPRGDGFPWATFTENVTGCFLLAVLMVVLLEVLPPMRYARPFLGVGVLGGFTTFSTYTADTRALLASGQAGIALAYLLGSVMAGLVAVVFGGWSARALFVRGNPDRPGRAVPEEAGS